MAHESEETPLRELPASRRVLPGPPAPVLALVAGLGLLGTLGLGLMLRWMFAGQPLAFGDFVPLRHAHSHLGYYGVLFPLMWWAWRRAGARAPGPYLAAFYGIAVLISTIGFAREGYGRPAIVGSTAVLVVWLLSAWGLRGELGRLRSWLGGVGPAILLSALCIVPVAVMAGQDPALGAGLVRGFLTLLLFGAMVPSALQLLRAPAPPWPLWLLAAVAGAAFLGPVEHPLLGLGLVGLGGMLAWALLKARGMGLVERSLWAGLALGLAAPGLGLVAPGHALAVAGVHYLVLGPLLLALGRPLWPRPLPEAAQAAYALSVVAMTLAIVRHDALASAWAGSAVAGAWGLGLLWAVGARLRRRRPGAGPTLARIMDNKLH